jgi:hypothetical protein
MQSVADAYSDFESVFLGGRDESEATTAEAIDGIRWWVELREAECGLKPATLELSAAAG